jgi:urease accessory protein
MTIRRFLLALLVLAVPGMALAHVGEDVGIHHGSAFLQGLIHPFTGPDHLLAMLAVGAWSALAMRRVWVAPAAFAGLMLVGGLLGVAAVAVPLVEPMIAVSLLILGLLVATSVRLPSLACATLIGAFAVFHGAAHGGELAVTRASGALAGTIAGTLVLHGAGLLLGHLVLKRDVWLPRAAGMAVALFGVGLLSGVL